MQAVTLNSGRRGLFYGLAGITAILILAALATPNLYRSRTPANAISNFARSEPLLKANLETRMGATQSAQISEPGKVQAATLDRKVVRKGTLDLVVADPSTALDEINGLARHHNGYVVSSELTGKQDSQRGTITIRVPAAQFDAARVETKQLAKRVEAEQTLADDITMQYAENEATLRNYRAEEASYLAIMKQSGRIKDTLEVAQELSDVRGRIERMQAQVRTMSLETEMSAIQVTVSAEPLAIAQHWRPIYELRAAWNDGLEALTTYVTAMMAILMYVPAAILWIATILLAGKLGWMLFRVGARLFSPPKTPATTV